MPGLWFEIDFRIEKCNESKIFNFGFTSFFLAFLNMV
jgi:hypothetical protein